MTFFQIALLVVAVLIVGCLLGVGMMALMVVAGEEECSSESDEAGTGITHQRIAELTLSAWSDCGTRTAIEIAAKEAYAAGVSAARNK